MRTSFSRLSASERALARLGTVVQQKYRIDRLIGVGGTAVVYAATHRNGHRVAIKFLLESLADDAEIRQLFSREAYVANRVGHPGTVPVLDDDTGEDGSPFLIMPLLEGESLRARWERANRRLPVAEVAVLMSDALEVLVSAHAKGIVHRDIKPDNLFITTAGSVRVLDFGIARHVMSDGGGTFSGRLVGTPAFMPPEQALGNGSAIGPHSDCWAMGATIFTLLSGEFVHPADNAPAQLAAAATRHARSLWDVLPDLPLPIVQFVGKALAYDPADRWRSAGEMRVALLETFEDSLGQSVAAVAARVRADLAEELSPKSTDSHATKTQPGERSPRPLTQDLPPREPATVSPRDRPVESPVRGSAETLAEPIPPTLRDAQVTPRTRAAEVATTRKSRRGRSAKFARIAALAGAGLLALMGAALVGAYGGVTTTRVVARLPSAMPESGAETTASNAEALVHFNAGIQYWRDAAERAAENSFARALELDPSLAAAHLYLAMTPTWTDDQTRAHHHAASAHRSRLGPRDRALLEAYAPAMAMPADLDTSAQRLLAIRETFPLDWLVLYALADTQIKRAELQNAVEVLDDLLHHDPLLAIAWAEKGLALASLEDLKGARDSLNECIRISNYGETCLELLVKLDSNEGQCVDAERHARTLMAVPSPRVRSAIRLAGAIHARGASLESVHDVLEHTWPLAPESRREIVRHQNETRFHVLAGRFAEAQRALDEWGHTVAGARYEDDHAAFAEVQFSMAMELGDPKRASRLASEYLAKRDAWLASTYYDWEILPLRIQYLAGGLSREAFQERRRIWLARQKERPQLVNARNLRWSNAYGAAVVSPDDAAEALRVLPEYLPLTDSLTRSVESDSRLGRVYLLAGTAEEALPYLRRGARSCDPIQQPFEHTWVNLDLGMALEQAGDVSGACAAYNVVLARWGEEPRSVSARMARTRRAALRCSTP